MDLVTILIPDELYEAFEFEHFTSRDGALLLKKVCAELIRSAAGFLPDIVPQTYIADYDQPILVNVVLDSGRTIEEVRRIQEELGTGFISNSELATKLEFTRPLLRICVSSGDVTSGTRYYQTH